MAVSTTVPVVSDLITQCKVVPTSLHPKPFNSSPYPQPLTLFSLPLSDSDKVCNTRLPVPGW